MQLLYVIKPQHILGILQSCVLRNDFFHAKHWNVQLIGQMNINTCLQLVHEEQAGGLEEDSSESLDGGSILKRSEKSEGLGGLV